MAKIGAKTTKNTKRDAGSDETNPEDKDWIESEEGRNRVLDLLRNAGTPLEVSVAGQCREFCRRHDGEDETRITTIRAIYGDSRSNKAPREVDQSVQFDREIDLNGDLSVRLRLRVPIECKCREGLEVFGFPRPKSERVASLPMLSDFAGATLLNQLAHTEPQIVRNGRESAITLLQTDKSKISEEQLIYKSGSSLYDFIRTVESEDNRLRIDKMVRESGLLDRFRDYCRPSGDWFSLFHKFVRDLSVDEVNEFNNQWLTSASAGGIYSLEVSFHVPVICIDARMFIVPCSRRGRLRSLLPCKTMMTGLRVDNWQRKMFYFLGKRTPEVLAIVSDPDGVQDVLDGSLEWFKEMATQLQNSDMLLVRRALLEGLLYNSTGRIKPAATAATWPAGSGGGCHIAPNRVI